MLPQRMAGKGLPQVRQRNGREMLELLRDVSGLFRPGTLSCLMVSTSFAKYRASPMLMIFPAAVCTILRD